MRAAVCVEFGKPLEIHEVVIADPRPTQVRVRIVACAICHSDIHFQQGAWGGRLPMVFGHEASGVVEEVGSAVTHIRPGDRVAVTLVNHCGGCACCRRGNYSDCETPDYEGSPLSYPDGGYLMAAMSCGAFAEQVVVHHSQLVPLGEDIPFEVAALMACGGITGFGAVANSADLRPGEDVVVIGCGGVGLNSVQAASLLGAGRVIAVDLSAERLEAARAFGATDVVNGAETDTVARVREITEGRGADFVFVTVGVAPVTAQGRAMLAPGGAVVIVGMPASGAKVEIEPLEVAYHSQRILGSHMGKSLISRDIPWLASLYRQGRIKMDELISARYPFERNQRRHRRHEPWRGPAQCSDDRGAMTA